jgi:hypothetical protein
MKKLNKLIFALLAVAFIAPAVAADDDNFPRVYYRSPASYSDAQGLAFEKYWSLFYAVEKGETQPLVDFLAAGRRYKGLFVDSGKRFKVESYSALARECGCGSHLSPVMEETNKPFYLVTDKDDNNLFHAIQNKEQLDVILREIKNSRAVIETLVYAKNKQRLNPFHVKLQEGNKALWGLYKYYTYNLIHETRAWAAGVDLENSTPEQLADFFGWKEMCAKNEECVKNYAANMHQESLKVLINPLLYPTFNEYWTALRNAGVPNYAEDREEAKEQWLAAQKEKRELEKELSKYLK